MDLRWEHPPEAQQVPVEVPGPSGKPQPPGGQKGPLGPPGPGVVHHLPHSQEDREGFRVPEDHPHPQLAPPGVAQKGHPASPGVVPQTTGHLHPVLRQTTEAQALRGHPGGPGSPRSSLVPVGHHKPGLHLRGEAPGQTAQGSSGPPVEHQQGRPLGVSPQEDVLVHPPDLPSDPEGDHVPDLSIVNHIKIIIDITPPRRYGPRISLSEVGSMEIREPVPVSPVPAGSATRFWVRAGLFAALTALGAFLRVPLPYVPFTLQYFFCALSGFLLGPRGGFASQGIYLVLGLAGLPVFTAGGGPAYVFQPSFGYLLGFLVAAPLVGGPGPGFPGAFSGLRDRPGGGAAGSTPWGCPGFGGVFHLHLGDPRTVRWAVVYGFLAPLGGDLVLCGLIALAAVRPAAAGGLPVNPQELRVLADRLVSDGAPVSRTEALGLLDAPPEDLLEEASRIRRAFSGRSVQLCAIVPFASGACGEDCAFCAQSPPTGRRGPGGDGGRRRSWRRLGGPERGGPGSSPWCWPEGPRGRGSSSACWSGSGGFGGRRTWTCAPPPGWWTRRRPGGWRRRGFGGFTGTWKRGGDSSPGSAPPTGSRTSFGPWRRPGRRGWRCAPGGFWGWGKAGWIGWTWP